jgi:hypothetical protein
MVDISKHPLLQKCHELMCAIERCGASPELTQVTVLASEVMNDSERLLNLIETTESRG